jgi:hypothetical protein
VHLFVGQLPAFLMSIVVPFQLGSLSLKIQVTASSAAGCFNASE